MGWEAGEKKHHAAIMFERDGFRRFPLRGPRAMPTLLAFAAHCLAQQRE